MFRHEPGDAVAASPLALLANEFKRRLAHVGKDHRGVGALIVSGQAGAVVAS
jgi:hypothetical protein